MPDPANDAEDLTSSQLQKIAAHFRLLGEPLRLRILQTLSLRPLSVHEIVEATGATQSNISRHLSLLVAAGVITRQKEGQFVYYTMITTYSLLLCLSVYSHMVDGTL